MPTVPIELLTAQYELKCLYVARGLEEKEYVGLLEHMRTSLSKAGAKIDWKGYEDIGISKDIFEKIAPNIDKKDIGLYFCHPNILHLIKNSSKYYRCISVFSQKGLKTVSKVSNVEKFESGSPVDAASAQSLAIAINRNLSALYKSSIPNIEKIKSLLYATAGITLDGSWKNQIGSEGERLIKNVIIQHAFKNKELVSVSVADEVRDSADITSQWIAEHAGSFRAAMFNNGSTARFGSEPDVTLLDAAGNIVAGIEVKAGLDPAGALERLGAMLKSFDSIIADAPKADRILVVACVTKEVEDRLKVAKSVSRYYSLTDIMLKPKDEGRFANMVRGVLGLVVARN